MAVDEREARKAQDFEHYNEAVVIDASLRQMGVLPKRSVPKDDVEYEVVWSGRDSLIPERDSRGSQLSGGEFSYAPESVIDQLDAETPAYRARMDTLMAERKVA